MARPAPPYSYRPTQRSARDATRPLHTPRHAPARRKRGAGVSFFRVVGFLALVLLTSVVMGALALGVLITRQAGRDEARPSDAIIVLGAAQWDGKPSPVLQARLDHAYDLYKAGFAPQIIVTGGVGTGDQYSEGEVGRRYLIAKGVPARAVLAENRGQDSFASMIGAARLMQQNGGTRALIVSDGFHLYRLKRIATDLGLSAVTSPTQTSPIRPGSADERRYIAREVASLAQYLFFER